jgi:hypothetical protein
LNKSKHQFNGHDYYRYVIYLRTRSKKVLNRMFAEGKHPCRSMYWILKNNLDISRICSMIQEVSGRTPISSSHIGSDQNKIMTSAHYTIKDIQIHLHIERSNREKADRVGLICEGMSNQVFFKLITFSPHTLNYWIFFMIK